MKTWFVALRALVVSTAFLSLWGWVALSFRRFDPRWGISLPAWMSTAGVAVMILGGALGLACVGSFVVRGGGTPAPFDPPRKFVAVGPYRYARNPMYIGGVLLLAGLGLYELSPSILMLSAVFLLAAHVFVVRVEEPGLRRKFGEAYEEYCRTVSRWAPWGRGAA